MPLRKDQKQPLHREHGVDFKEAFPDFRVDKTVGENGLRGHFQLLHAEKKVNKTVTWKLRCLFNGFPPVSFDKEHFDSDV